MSLMLLPLIPSLNSLNLFLSESVNYFAYLKNIAYLERLSGNSNFIDKSNRDNMAASKSYFLLVAQINKTLELLSKESIFLNNVDNILRLASCISPSLDYANESISSIKIITLPNF